MRKKTSKEEQGEVVLTDVHSRTHCTHAVVLLRSSATSCLMKLVSSNACFRREGVFGVNVHVSEDR